MFGLRGEKNEWILSLLALGEIQNSHCNFTTCVLLCSLFSLHKHPQPFFHPSLSLSLSCFCMHPPFFCQQGMYAHAPFCDTFKSRDKWDIMVCSLHHSWQTSVSQTFSFSLICSSDTERKVDILERDWICSLAPWLPTLSSSSQCSSSYYLAFTVVSTMPARIICQRGGLSAAPWLSLIDWLEDTVSSLCCSTCLRCRG